MPRLWRRGGPDSVCEHFRVRAARSVASRLDLEHSRIGRIVESDSRAGESVIRCPGHMLGAVMAWRQGQSYSEDLRARFWWPVDGGMAARAAASVFRVSVSDIYKALVR